MNNPLEALLNEWKTASGAEKGIILTVIGIVATVGVYTGRKKTASSTGTALAGENSSSNVTANGASNVIQNPTTLPTPYQQSPITSFVSTKETSSGSNGVNNPLRNVTPSDYSQSNSKTLGTTNGLRPILVPKRMFS